MIRAVLIMLAMAVSYFWACDYQGEERKQIILTMWVVYPCLVVYAGFLINEWRKK